MKINSFISKTCDFLHFFLLYLMVLSLFLSTKKITLLSLPGSFGERVHSRGGTVCIVTPRLPLQGYILFPHSLAVSYHVGLMESNFFWRKCGGFLCYNLKFLQNKQRVNIRWPTGRNFQQLNSFFWGRCRRWVLPSLLPASYWARNTSSTVQVDAALS